MDKKLIVGLLLSFMALLSWANNLPDQWFTLNGKQATLHVNLFTVSTCPYCQKAEAFLNDLAKKYPWLEIQTHVINIDKKSLVTFNQFLQEQKINDFSVPAIFFCGSRWVGFKDSAQSGKQLLAGLNYCHEQISETGELSSATVQTLKQMASANWYEENLSTLPSSPSFIPLMAVVDGLNPSVTLLIFSFIAFLMILTKSHNRFMILAALILGAGIAHYMQLAYLSFFHHLFTFMRPLAALIGFGLILFILMIQKKYKAQLTWIRVALFVFLTAFIIQCYVQVNSTPNFSLIVKQWLVNEQFSAGKQIFYQLVYVIVYVITLTLNVLIAALLVRMKRFQKYLPAIERLAEAFLLTVGLVLIIYPYELSRILTVFIVIGFSVLFTWLLTKFNTKKEKSL